MRVNRTQRAMVRWHRRGRLGQVVAVWLHYRLARTWGCYIRPQARLSSPFYAHPVGVVIGEHVVVEERVTIYQHVTLGATRVGGGGYPTVRRGATIYAGASVLGAVEIGENAVVGANSVVLCDVPPGALAIGTPATVRPRSATGTG